jgi:two-component system, LytTR family, response regulator AlgR
MATEAPLRTLIVDDEPLAIERLQVLCADVQAISLVGTASDGAAALRLVEALTPDLLILDIAMPGIDGLDVARTLAAAGNRTTVIYVTAFDQYAVAAFDVAAVDYLLKPVSPERLVRAIERVCEHRAATPVLSKWASEFWVPHRGDMVRLAVEDIDLIEAERDYMRLHIGARTYLLHQTISALEARLDPERFIRIHRSTIVRRDRIVRLTHDVPDGWCVETLSAVRLRVGRSYVKAVRAMVGR